MSPMQRAKSSSFMALAIAGQGLSPPVAARSTRSREAGRLDRWPIPAACHRRRGMRKPRVLADPVARRCFQPGNIRFIFPRCRCLARAMIFRIRFARE
jgi:hypothetical protein